MLRLNKPNSQASDTSAYLTEAEPGRSRARRTLAAAGAVHALHDGYTDLIYILLPV